MDSSDELNWLLWLTVLMGAGLGLLAWGRRRAEQAHHRAVRALAAESRHYAAVMNSVPDAVLSVDARQRIVLFNPAAERLFGCTMQDVLGTSMERFVPADSRLLHAEHMLQFGRAGGRRLHREVQALHADGHLLDVEASVSQVEVPMDSGTQRLFTVLLRDLTKRKAAEEEMRRMQARYRSVVELSPDAIWVAESGRVVLANPAAVRLAGGESPADLMGREMTELLPAFSDVLTSVDDGAPGPVFSEQRLHRLDGGERDVKLSVARVPDHGKGAVQVIMRDIGERKRLARLQQERERLLQQQARIAQTVPGVILERVLKPDGRICIAFASAMFEKVYGLAPGPLAEDATPVIERIHPADRDRLTETLARSAADLSAWHQEWRYQHPIHGERWFEGRSMPRRDADGTVTWSSFVMDITERKRAEAAADEHRSRLQEAERIAHIGHFDLDVGSGFWTLSDSMCRLLGRPQGGMLSYQQGLQLLLAADRPAMEHHIRHEAINRHEPLDHECRVVRMDTGEQRWMHWRGTLRVDDAGQPVRIFGTVQDVTEQRQARLTLERSREELQRLSANLNTAREEERRHFSRELHDELGQRLQAIRLDIAALLKGGEVPPEQLRALLRSVDVTVAATRRIAADLRPAMLDDLGLGAAIEWLVRDWSARACLDIRLEQDALDDELNEVAATAVYRIVQEALTNVTRHARARNVRVLLRREAEELVMAVEDDGLGLAPGDEDKRDSHGLVGMRERARNLGGDLTLTSLPTGGCRLEARLPLDRVDSQFGHCEEER